MSVPKLPYSQCLAKYWKRILWSTYPQTQDVNWTYVKRSDDVQDVFRTSYVLSIYVLCLRGSLALRSVFDRVLMCVSLTNRNLLHNLILHFDRKKEKKKTNNNHIKRLKYGSISSHHCPVLWIIYVMMHGKEEWDLIQFASQHKSVERAVRLVFPDYVSVSFYYVLNKPC